MLKRISIIILSIMLLTGINVQAEVKTNEAAPDFKLTDSNGKEHSLSDFKGKYVILEWVNYECPFVVKHYKSGNMQSLQKELSSDEVVWLSINSSAEGKQGNYAPEQVNEIMANSDAHPTAYLLDAEGDVGQLYGAKTTPHMFIINPEGNVIYQGAIDDKPTFDQNDIPGATNYVREALTAAKKGESFEPATTTPYGCSVKY
jgi:peroxiredoxin